MHMGRIAPSQLKVNWILMVGCSARSRGGGGAGGARPPFSPKYFKKLTKLANIYPKNLGGVLQNPFLQILDPPLGCGWLYDALPKQAVWRPRLAVDGRSLGLATDNSTEGLEITLVPRPLPST